MRYSDYLMQESYGELDLVNCPWCKTGKLVIRVNNKTDKDFLGCSHYPNCNQAYNNIEILDEPIICPSCQSGFLVKRSGKYGEFLGCINYPDCRQTLQLFDFHSAKPKKNRPFKR